MIIRITERGEYKRCRRRWHFGSPNRMGLEKVGISPTFGLGLAIHEALAKWMVYDREGEYAHNYLPDDSGTCNFAFTNGMQTARCGYAQEAHYTYVDDNAYSLSDEYMRVCARMVSEAQAAYRARNGAEMGDAELGPFMDVVLLGRAMMNNYQEHHRSPLPPGFTLVAPEQDIVLDIPNTEHTEEWVWDEYEGLTGGMKLVRYDTPRFHQVGGRLDAIIKDEQGWLYAPDHKTYSSRSKEEVLRYNDQFTGYTYMLGRLNLGKVAGVAYDGMWKREKPPKGSTLPDLFTRLLIKPSPHELKEFEQHLAWEAMEMASNPHITKDRRWDGSCQWGCAFDQLCLATMRGEDTKYVLNTAYQKRPRTTLVDERDA